MSWMPDYLRSTLTQINAHFSHFQLVSIEQSATFSSDQAQRRSICCFAEAMGANSPNHEAVQSCLHSWSIIVPLATSFLHKISEIPAVGHFRMLHFVTYVRALLITKTLQGHHAHTEVLSARFLILLFLAILIGHSRKRLIVTDLRAWIVRRNDVQPQLCCPEMQLNCF
jgi:hypothetical protein